MGAAGRVLRVRRPRRVGRSGAGYATRRSARLAPAGGGPAPAPCGHRGLVAPDEGNRQAGRRCRAGGADARDGGRIHLRSRGRPARHRLGSACALPGSRWGFARARRDAPARSGFGPERPPPRRVGSDRGPGAAPGGICHRCKSRPGRCNELPVEAIRDCRRERARTTSGLPLRRVAQRLPAAAVRPLDGAGWGGIPGRPGHGDRFAVSDLFLRGRAALPKSHQEGRPAGCGDGVPGRHTRTRHRRGPPLDPAAGAPGHRAEARHGGPGCAPGGMAGGGQVEGRRSCSRVDRCT